MRHYASGGYWDVFNEELPIWDMKLGVRPVRLVTPDGLVKQVNGSEEMWRAVWDTGSPVTIIPHDFVDAVKLHAVTYTKKPITGYDSRPSGPHPCYHVRIGLPRLPLFKVMAIAPDDSTLPPTQRRRHITLGRDMICRLVVAAVSNVPWDDQHTAGQRSRWRLSYRRRVPELLRGWWTLLRRWWRAVLSHVLPKGS